MYKTVFLQLKEKNQMSQSFVKDDYIKFRWRESTVLEPIIVDQDKATHFCLVDEAHYIFLPEEIGEACTEFDPIYNNTPETIGGIVWDIELYFSIMEVL